MKKTLLTISIMAGLMMTACVKESANEQMGLPEGAMMLTTEGFQGHNTKTSVSGTSVQWVGDGTEKVYLNGNKYTVRLAANGNAYVTAADGDKTSTTYGYYGVSGVSASDVTNFTVTVPASYTSSYSGGRQVIALPMVAYNATGDKIEFKHVTAAVKVRVKNNTGYDVYLDSVVVSSDAYQLSGTTSAFDVTAANLSIAANKTEVAAVDKRVKVAFANKAVTIANGGSDIKEVQVPILPVGSDANLTIKVYTHKLVARTGMPSVNYDYNFVHTSTVPAALVRNVMITAQVEIKEQTNDVDNHITEVDHSLFAVTRGGAYPSYTYTYARFSRGNLQYVPKTATWSFHASQYAMCESVSSQSYVSTENTTRYGSSEGTDAIDLFSWGTSGQNHGATSYMPYCNTTINSEYYAYGDKAKDLSSSTGTADWGYNDITGEGTGKWRTLTSTNTNVLFNLRTTRTYGLAGTNATSAKYTKAIVCGVKGLILFPDDYLHPEGLTTESGTHSFNTTNAAYTTFVLTDDDEWKLMEEAGAIFLPAVGYREGSKIYFGGGHETYPQGWYWTSDHNNDNTCKNLNFSATALNYSSTNTHNRYRGCCIRLVKDVE